MSKLHDNVETYLKNGAGVGTFTKMVLDLLKENRELREALAIYADEKMYHSQWNKQLKVYNKMEIKKDRGEIARKALGEGE